MMFKRISFKRLLAFLAVLIMAVSFSLTAFAADDDDENKEPAGTPIINVISGNVYEIEPGQETSIAMLESLDENDNNVMFIGKLKK